MRKSFIEQIKDGYKQGIEAENAQKPEGKKLTTQKQRKNLFILLIGLVGIFFLVKSIIGGGKPSACDCQKVMIYGDGAVDAAKRILGGSYGANFMERSQTECGLIYWEDIKKWEEIKGLNGTPVDNAMEYFMEKCN
jgi:hypothetical protein